MAIDDIVDLMIMLRRRGGEELEQQAGEEGISIVQQMDGVIRERMVGENDLYVQLWREFDVDAPTNRAEMIGALEAMAEGDAELGDYLAALFSDYNQLTLQHGAAWRPPDEEEGQELVGGLRDEAAVGEGEHSPVTRIGDVVEGLPDEDEEGDGVPDDSRIPGRDDVIALDELDEMTAGEEVEDLALLDTDSPTRDFVGGDLPLPGDLGVSEDLAAADTLGENTDPLAEIDGMRDEHARTGDMGVEDWADMQEEAGMLSDDTRATMPGGPLGEVPVENELEGIGGDTYVHGRFLPDEDIEDEYRPGTLYDTNADNDLDQEMNLRSGVVTVGDVQDALEPARASLDEDPDFDAQAKARLHASLDGIERELTRGKSADVDSLRIGLARIRDASTDLWQILAWELADLLPDFDPAIQVALRRMGGPLDAGKQ